MASNSQIRRLIIHIGQPKTGSTILQSVLTAMQDKLKEYGTLYPKSYIGEAGRNHSDLADVAAKGSDGELAKYVSAIREQVNTETVIILSSEVFYDLKEPQRLVAELRKQFPKAEIDTIAYVREFVRYSLSLWAHHVKSGLSTADPIANSRIYNQTLAQQYRLWHECTDRMTLRIYDRKKLVNNDISADMLSFLGHDELIENIPIINNDNNSLSGNLLGLKLILNMLGKGALIPYRSWEVAANLDPSFSGAVRVDKSISDRLASMTTTNEFIRRKVGEIEDFNPEKGSLVFDLERWDEDMKLLAKHEDFWIAPVIRLSHIQRALKSSGVVEIDPNEHFADGVEPPSEDFVNRYVGYGIFKYAKDTHRTNISLNRQLEGKQERLVELQNKIEMLEQNFREAKPRIEKQNVDIKQLSENLTRKKSEHLVEKEKLLAQIATITSDRDSARSELKAQSEKFKLEAGKVREAFKVQLDNVSSDRDKARSELKIQAKKLSDKMQGSLKTFQSQIETLRAERSDASKQIKKLEGERDKARLAFNSKSEQLDIQAGQVFFFRAELFRLKGDINKARELYQNALEKDPKNKDYAEKLAQLD